MNDALSSLVQWLKEKSSSSLYFTFVSAFIVWNWKALYVLFIDDSQMSFHSRFIYIENVIYFGNGLCAWLLTHLLALGGPALITWAAIYWLPRLNTLAHGIENKYRHVRIDNDIDFRINSLDKQITLEERERKLHDLKKEKEKEQESEWDKEYKKLMSQGLANHLHFIREIIVNHQGKSQNPMTGRLFYPDSVEFGDLNDIINIEPSSDTIAYTQKGKYFANKVLHPS